MSSFWFFIVAFLTLFGALVAIVSKKPMQSALGLLLSSLSLSGLYLLLDARFLFMAQIIVYVGAVITLILMILMFLNLDESQLPNETNRYLKIGLGVILMIPFNFIILKELSFLPFVFTEEIGSTKVIGEVMFRSWLIPFELISILLLVALIGAIILAKKLKKKETQANG